jgi:superfamily II DNA/RNA helicase
VTSFEEIGVPARAAQALQLQGIITPNPVQREAIPALLAGRDTVIQAPTGSGKTLAFLLPMIHRFDGHRDQGPRGLIVAPTRELASQIAEVLRGLDRRLRIALLFGGVPYGKQLTSLRDQPDVVIGCPGRIVDLARQRAARFGAVQFLVLDEADEMLDQGFAPDVERIIAQTPATRQTVLASATMPDWVRTMIAKHLTNPETIRVHTDVEPDLEHGLFSVRRDGKLETLNRLLRAQSGRTIVFHRTKHGAKKLSRDLDKLGHFTAELQGNLSQNARDRAISSFRRGDSHVLVATNVAARGIDVSDVGLVVNYELPDTADWLTHRVGRTARNGAKGHALTFVTEDDHDQWKKLRRLGAPDLPHVDADRLLDSGEWAYLAVAPHLQSQLQRPAHPSRSDANSRQYPRASRPEGQSRHYSPAPQRRDAQPPRYARVTQSESVSRPSPRAESSAQPGSSTQPYSRPEPSTQPHPRSGSPARHNSESTGSRKSGRNKNWYPRPSKNKRIAGAGRPRAGQGSGSSPRGDRDSRNSRPPQGHTRDSSAA